MTRMAEVIYVLCMLTSLTCAMLLGIAYRRTRTHLLLWSSLCFVGLTANNLLLFLDIVIFPSLDLGPFRDWSGVISMALIVFGLVWNND
jgi:hypothetical protein